MINRRIYHSNIYIKTTGSIHRNIQYPSYYSKYTKTTLKIWQSKVPLSNFKWTNPIKIQWHFKKTYKKVLFSVKISVAVKKYEINLEALFLSCCIQSWRVQLTHRQTVMAAWDWLIVLCVQCCYGDRAVLSASLQYTLFIFLAIVSLSYV